MLKTVVSLCDIDFGVEEEQAVLEVLRSRWISSGEVTASFEREFGQFVGAPHVIAVANCTAALHLACVALGLGPGDEVLVPSLTFVATANAVRYTGARPVFVDIDSLNDWTISVEGIRRQISPNTRAIIPMHYGGFPCQMATIMEIAREHGLYVIEDAAHGPGSWFGSRHIGTFGDAGCFSFFANKNMTTGEGGAVVTANQELAEKIRLLRSHGMTSLSWDRHRGHAYQYDVVTPGFNYRLDELRAALGRAQLCKLGRNNERRAERYAHYVKLLSQIGEIRVPFCNYSGNWSCHLFPILLPEKTRRTELMKCLRAKGIQTSIHYPPVHQFSIYRTADTRPLPLTEGVGRRELTLPLHPLLDLEDIEDVVRELKECL